MSDIQIQPERIAIVRVFAVLVAGVMVVLLLVWLLTGGGGEIFESKSYLHSYMADASGLIRTAAVQLNGIQIGKISDVKLSGLGDPKKVVWVEMKVKSKYLPAIPVDSTITITADNILGDKYLNISSGQRSESVQSGAELRSVLPIGNQFNSADLVAALKDNLNRIDASIRQIEDAKGSLGQFVATENFYNQLRAEIVSVQGTVAKFAHPQGDLGKLVFSEDFYDQIRAPIAALDQSLASIQAGEGQTGHMLASSESYDQIRQSLADIRTSLAKTNAGEGPAGHLLQSDETYRQLQRLVKSIGEMVDSVNSGETQLGQVLINSQLYESLTGSTVEMQQFMGDFRRNPRKYLRLKVF